MELSDYQRKLRKRLEKKLRSETVCEWRTKMTKGTYSPRLDVAVGPFSLVDGVRLIQEYDNLLETNIDFVTSLIKIHLSNLSFITKDTPNDKIEEQINYKLDNIRYFNRNARCFIGIEIENSVTRKHLMGGAINASALGRIGIAVGYTTEMHNAFLNLYRYFTFLQDVDKPTFKTNNLLIVSSSQLLDICRQKK